MTEINYLEILKLCFLGGKGGCSGCPFKNEGFPKCLNTVYKGIEDTIKGQQVELEKAKKARDVFKATTESQAETIGSLLNKLKVLKGKEGDTE